MDAGKPRGRRCWRRRAASLEAVCDAGWRGLGGGVGGRPDRRRIPAAGHLALEPGFPQRTAIEAALAPCGSPRPSLLLNSGYQLCQSCPSPHAPWPGAATSRSPVLPLWGPCWRARLRCALLPGGVPCSPSVQPTPGSGVWSGRHRLPKTRTSHTHAAALRRPRPSFCFSNLCASREMSSRTSGGASSHPPLC